MTNTPSLNLCFFWHMHQPDYRGSDGVMRMPWVFLHAIKDYYEMPWLLSEHRGLKATFNLSASLIEQLQLYREPLKYDYFLSLWAQHPSTLQSTQRAWLIKLFTGMQYETMVRPLKRYGELYYQTSFTDEELIDLEVLFLLGWCGNYLRVHNPYVNILLQKEKGYIQEEKHLLLETLSGFVQEILPFYKELQEKGVISISTTPYFHPILPLLLDMENGKRANEATPLPIGAHSLYADAQEHVERSIALYERTFGRKPNGFWPAEGAVDEKSVKIYKEHAIQWIATDEAILYKSLQNDDTSLRYKPYTFDGVTIGFRDHNLSDLIGFEYGRLSGTDASEDLIKKLKHIVNNEKDPTVFVIVDGENAWEFYPNNGLEFFNGVYGLLSNASWCTTVTMDEVANRHDNTPLEHLSPGSWIHGTFDTWVGDIEKNRAWELIFQTRRDVQNYQGAITKEVREKITYHFLASECSDWFWWYGEDHRTDYAAEFDLLFREHLIEIYRLLNLDIPSTLFDSILILEISKPFWTKPRSKIYPQIGEKRGAFFSWIGAGMIDERLMFSTMDKGGGVVEILYYGFDDTSFYVAFEGDFTSLEDPLVVVVMIEEMREQFSITPVVLGNRLEFSFSRAYFKTNTTIHLRFKLRQDDQTIQSLPGNGYLLVEFDETFGTNWFI
ncbi:MAG: glycoside hydrolase family 57 protein [Campylobacterales bacterium]|nr:glycoside hydrolase family 57 protein [Campylobacterales bacterium]